MYNTVDGIMAATSSKKATLIIGVLVLGIVIASAFYIVGTAPATDMRTFMSFSEMEAYLKKGLTSNYYRGGYDLFLKDYAVATNAQESAGTGDYSTTNVQVAGVDEADIIKTDGFFIYAVAGQTLYIIRAIPAENATILSEISFNSSYNPEIYIDGDRLVVIGNDYEVYLYSEPAIGIGVSDARIYMPHYSNTGFVKVFDISDKTSPTLVKDIFINGTISGSRMVGDYVYLVSNKPSMLYYSTPVVDLPSFTCNNITTSVQATDVKYVDTASNYYNFITVMAINVQDNLQQPSTETFLAGSSSTMYVSTENMYLVVYSSHYRSLLVSSEWIEETLIYRLHFVNEAITVEASGVVPGNVLDQFSMDESGGYFRVATTEWTTNGSRNSLFVLNMDLEKVGSIENIAPGERIYSARFMGDKCYLVTFRQVDPFYVIDLSAPTAPEILGILKIPGYSDYLHPLGDNYIIGVGKEGNNIKLSLFDVSNVSDPKEVAKYMLNYTYSDSEALRDHKAFLFDEQRGLLVLPVSWSSGRDWTYSQGAYAFNLTVDNGFVLKGVINHQVDTNTSSWDYAVSRSLYIGNTLYTLSSEKLVMNDIWSLAQINAIIFP